MNFFISLLLFNFLFCGEGLGDVHGIEFGIPHCHPNPFALNGVLIDMGILSLYGPKY